MRSLTIGRTADFTGTTINAKAAIEAKTLMFNHSTRLCCKGIVDHEQNPDLSIRE
jgi:hypothetical protein